MKPRKPRSPAVDPLIEQRVYHVEPDWHEHGYCQVLLGQRGEAELEMGGRLYRTRARHGVIVPAGWRHDFAGDADNCQLVIDLPTGSVAVPHVLFDRPREFIVPPTLDRALSRLPAGSAARRRQYDWLLAVQAVGQVGLLLAGEAGDAARFPVREIDAYLREQRDVAPVDTASLAERFGWKPRRFHDLFYEAFGDTPQHYQTRLRLDRALSLLAEPGLPLVEIANRLGYADQQAFTRRFSERFGLPPGRWRSGI